MKPIVVIGTQPFKFTRWFIRKELIVMVHHHDGSLQQWAEQFRMVRFEVIGDIFDRTSLATRIIADNFHMES